MQIGRQGEVDLEPGTVSEAKFSMPVGNPRCLFLIKVDSKMILLSVNSLALDDYTFEKLGDTCFVTS